MLEGAQEGGKGGPFVRLLFLPLGSEEGGKLLLLNLLLVHFLGGKEGGNGFLLFLQFQGEEGNADKGQGQKEEYLHLPAKRIVTWRDRQMVALFSQTDPISIIFKQ